MMGSFKNLAKALGASSNFQQNFTFSQFWHGQNVDFEQKYIFSPEFLDIVEKIQSVCVSKSQAKCYLFTGM